MILLGTYKNKGKENLIFFSEHDGKCIFFNKPNYMDMKFYNYFDKLELDFNDAGHVVDIDNLGKCNMATALGSIKFVSGNLKSLNSPKESKAIIFFEDNSEIVKLNREYRLKFTYKNERYEYPILDSSIVGYLNESKDNINIINNYIINKKIILVIIKDEKGYVNIIKMHSIK